MGIVRREKRRRLRAVKKMKPYLNLILDDTEFMIKQIISTGGSHKGDVNKEIQEVITNNNLKWRGQCERYNVMEVLPAYVDGVSMIKTRLEYEQKK